MTYYKNNITVIVRCSDSKISSNLKSGDDRWLQRTCFKNFYYRRYSFLYVLLIVFVRTYELKQAKNI